MKHIILASNSPRRRELLAGLNLDFEVRVLPGIPENYPRSLPASEVAGFIAREKADAYREIIGQNDLVVTADTVVVVGNEILGKPKDKERCFSVTTDVTFKQLSEEEITYYIENYKPFDKAGSYGIQEWIGYVGVTSISGSYFNVMGLPVQRVWEEIKKL